MQMKKSNYPLVVEEAKKLAKELGIEMPAALMVRHGPPPNREYGPPVEHFEQVLEAVASLFAAASEELGYTPPSKPVKKSPVKSVGKKK